MTKITDAELEQIVKYLNELEESRTVYDIPLIRLIESLSIALPENIKEALED